MYHRSYARFFQFGKRGVDSDRRQSANHKELAECLCGRNNCSRDRKDACNNRHCKEAEDKPREDFEDVEISLEVVRVLAVAIASFLLRRSWINANTTTVGIIASVLVSFTIVAKSPAPSEKA